MDEAYTLAALFAFASLALGAPARAQAPAPAAAPLLPDPVWLLLLAVPIAAAIVYVVWRRRGR